MIEPWELLLHHSYSGTPGVIFDDSPKRRNHGRAVGLNPADYQADGLSSGSGAIRFHNNGMVRVVPSEVWDGLSVVRCEIVCWCDAGGGGVLVDGGSFKFWLLDGAPSFQYELANTGSGKAFGPVSSDGTPPVPFNQWVTMSFFFDGIIGNSSYSLGSTPLTQFDSGQPAPLAATNKIVVGNGLDGRDPFRGLIDDIKIWRLDPKWVDKTFTHRPVDPRVRDCWDKWSDGLGKALGRGKCLRRGRDEHCFCFCASPSSQYSIFRNTISIKMVCGQAQPQNTLPKTTVKRITKTVEAKKPMAKMKKSCGQNIWPNKINFLSSTLKRKMGCPFNLTKGRVKNIAK